jgi:hypothetical protein
MAEGDKRKKRSRVPDSQFSFLLRISENRFRPEIAAEVEQAGATWVPNAFYLGRTFLTRRCK